jgi:excisionase family DNA binding protein
VSIDLAMKDLITSTILSPELVTALAKALAQVGSTHSTGGLLSVKAAASRAGVSTGLLRKWRKAGTLKEYRAGSRVLVKWEDLEALLQGAGPTENASGLAPVESIMSRSSKRKAG